MKLSLNKDQALIKFNPSKGWSCCAKALLHRFILMVIAFNLIVASG